MKTFENITINELENYMKSKMKETNSNDWQEHVDKLHRESNILIVDHLSLIK